MDHMNMMIDEDYMGLMSDTLFSTITNQPFAFPDTRELAKSGFADFIQPSLGPLQPNLDDYMDTFDPLQELYASNKLPTVPEEQQQHPVPWEDYRDFSEPVNPSEISTQVSEVPNTTSSISQYQTQIQELTQQTSLEKSLAIQDGHQNVMSATPYSSIMLPFTEYVQNSSYPIIPKLNTKSSHSAGRYD